MTTLHQPGGGPLSYQEAERAYRLKLIEFWSSPEPPPGGVVGLEAARRKAEDRRIADHYLTRILEGPPRPANDNRRRRR